MSPTIWRMLKDLSHLIFPFKVWPFFNFIYLFNLSICLSVLLFMLAFLILSVWRNLCSCKNIPTFTFTPMYFSTLPSKSTSGGPSSSRSSSPCSPSYGNETEIYTIISGSTRFKKNKTCFQGYLNSQTQNPKYDAPKKMKHQQRERERSNDST